MLYIPTFTEIFVGQQLPIKVYQIDFESTEGKGFILFRLSVAKRPLGNCQMFTIGHFTRMLFHGMDADQIKDIVYTSSDKTGQPLCLLDLKEKDFEKVKKIFPHMKSFPYASSNGSSMVICIVDTRIRD